MRSDETLQAALDDTLHRYVLMEDKWKEQIAATEDAVSKLGECEAECERQKEEMRKASRSIERLRASVKRGEEEIEGLQAAAVILQSEADIGLQSREAHQKPVRRELLRTQLALAAMVLFLLFLVYETGGAAVAPVTGRVTAGLEALRRVAEDALAYALSACRRQSCDADWNCHWHCTLLG